MRFKERSGNKRILLACMAAFLLLLPSVSAEQPNETAPEQAVVVVAFTSDVNGYIEPCG
jgi:hypothetical protein